MKVEIILRCDEDHLDINEQLYIEALDTMFPRGYNLRAGKTAARNETKHALSTHVRDTVWYESEADRSRVQAAVSDDIAHLTNDGDDGFKPWAGVVKMSSDEVCRIRAEQERAGKRNSDNKKEKEKKAAQDVINTFIRIQEQNRKEREAEALDARKERDAEFEHKQRKRKAEDLVFKIKELKSMGYDQEAATVLKEYMAL